MAIPGAKGQAHGAARARARPRPSTPALSSLVWRRTRSASRRSLIGLIRASGIAGEKQLRAGSEGGRAGEKQLRAGSDNAARGG